ncbi:MAG: heme-binding domain-containing protein, partial [Balneolales bacterium]|nr:heme-binding domain-containing protein [Balneolales bacterium]
MAKKILLVLAAALVILQFFQIDKTNPASDPELDLMVLTNPHEEVKQILKTACYDCHSNSTTYPWYTNIQPVGWWVKGHIDHGKEHVNYAEFGSYPPRRGDHKLEESVEYVLNKEMPLPSYTWFHGDTRLT